ncbi:MAG: hypothetical protein JW724_05965, partial [Candidatus Altiarchaeota archaeon]|nr:hypothetical protein [Candidatus Altiarchaeota archaeon]
MLYGKTENTGQDGPDIQDSPQPEDQSPSARRFHVPQSIRLAWDGIHPGNKRRIVIACLALTAVAVMLAGYTLSGRSFSGKDVQKPAAENKMREIDLDKKMVEKGLYESTRSSLALQNAELEKIKHELEKLKETPPAAHDTAPAATAPSQDTQPARKEVTIPPPPGGQQAQDQGKRKSMYEPPPLPPAAQEFGFTGGISLVSNNEP